MPLMQKWQFLLNKRILLRVDKILKDYRKNANIPGFRKGHVPMGMIKKQYETAVTADEVNKLLQENLNNYIQEEKIELLGNPLPCNEGRH